MKFLKRVWAIAAIIGLSACGGGGGGAGNQVLGGGGNTPTVADVVVVFSSDTIPNTGTRTVTATITAVDANRAGLADIPITVAVDKNAVVTPSATKTDSTGKITAVIGIGSDRTNRDITVTATAGTASKSAILKVITDPTTTNPIADDLSLTLSAPSLTNGGSTTILATATAVDRNRNVVAGIPVTITVDASAIAQVSGPTTNAQGVVTANVGIGADRSNRVVTVTATTGTIVKTASFAVTGAKLTSAAAPLVTAGTTGNIIEYTLVDFNGLAMPAQRIQISAPGLPPGNGTTDINGKFRFSYTAPAAGILQILASAAGDSRSDTVTVTAGGSGVPPADEVPRSASVTPTPSVVTVNSPGSNTNQVELRALFIGNNNKPIPRVRVRFDLAGNTTNTDGEVTFVGDYAYSDENGVARGTFTPRLRSSPTNGVTIRICYDVVDFTSASRTDCTGAPRFATTTLTVSSEALAVSVRTNELIKSGAANLTYIKEYVVMVVDSSGQAKPDVLITPSVDLTGYYKGFYTFNGLVWVQNLTLAADEFYQWNGTAWAKAAAVPNTIPFCPNEDINRNGVREARPFSATAQAPALADRQEDLNWNGELDPRKSDVAIKVVGSNRTDANGLAIVQIEYGRDIASWVDFIITVTASGVSGTEARARYIGNLSGLGNLPFPADSVTNPVVAPPFVNSPYGRSTTCVDPN